MRGTEIGEADRDLLLSLLRLPTAGPLEIGTAGGPWLWEAQRRYADAAAGTGFTCVHHAAARPEDVLGADVPLAVRERAHQDGFLDSQPSMVLRLGPQLPREATVMCNVHLDTVAGMPPVRFDGRRFHGRGAIDAKGPAVALLAGVRAAANREPSIGRDVAVLIQAVAGEEGGAMGTLGTRPLVRRGHVGRLNLFCEPTRLRYLPRATAAATARIRVRGQDAIDDRPGDGHNATVLLGFLAQHLGRTLADHRADGRVCVAGLHTGRLHNRVYGSGDLLLNLAYADAGAGRRLAEAVHRCLADGLARFQDTFAGVRDLARTAADAAKLTRLEWLKRGLPTLDCADPWAEWLLADVAGIPRWPADEPAFTCDAIWLHGVAGTFTAVLGPGDLATNQAHADGEYADLSELEEFADAVARVLVAFARETRAGGVAAAPGGALESAAAEGEA